MCFTLTEFLYRFLTFQLLLLFTFSLFYTFSVARYLLRMHECDWYYYPTWRYLGTLMWHGHDHVSLRLVSAGRNFTLLDSNFSCVLDVTSFLLGDASASEFYMPLFRDRQSVPKCWNIKYRRRGITQKKEYNFTLAWNAPNIGPVCFFLKKKNCCRDEE
jgi:hypothetical protein